MPPFIKHEPFNERVKLPGGGHIDLRVPEPGRAKADAEGKRVAGPQKPVAQPPKKPK